MRPDERPVRESPGPREDAPARRARRLGELRPPVARFARDAKLGVIAVACVLAGAAALPAEAARKTRTSASVMTSDARLNAKGRLVVKRQEATKKLPAREILDVSLSKLDPAGKYSLWIDSPFDETNDLVWIVPYEIVPKRNRTALVRYDDAAGDLPFGGALADLAGRRVQVRDGTGAIALTGTVPAIRPPKSGPR